MVMATEAYEINKFKTGHPVLTVTIIQQIFRENNVLLKCWFEEFFSKLGNNKVCVEISWFFCHSGLKFYV